MTDNEIIKALECCSTYKGKCTDCPAFVKVDRSNCKQVLFGAIEIINRQKAEIERLEELVYLADNETANVRDLYFEEKSERAEAIKEFCEKRGVEYVESDI